MTNLKVLNSRECGTCRVCCTVMGVQEIGKPYNTACQHVDSKIGCKIYENRPESCRVYECLWKLGDGPDDFRPDKSGFLLGFGTENNQFYIEIYECWPQYMLGNRQKAIKVLNGLTEKFRGSQIKLFPYKAKVGVDYEIKEPYSNNSYLTENMFLREGGMNWWIGPAKVSPNAPK